MRNRFDRQLSQLNDELIEMGSMIEKAIENAINALVNKDIDLAKEVIESDEDIDHQERTIENICMKLLLQQQPVAKDLQLVSSALKMITDMERIGDHAADISEMTVWMQSKEYTQHLERIQQMAKVTMVMLVGSINAFVNKNLEQAREVIARDDEVDALFLNVKSEVIQWIREGVDQGEQVADLLMVAKYFERIGDHATNISEWVIFSITGKHIKKK